MNSKSRARGKRDAGNVCASAWIRGLPQAGWHDSLITHERPATVHERSNVIGTPIRKPRHVAGKNELKRKLDFLSLQSQLADLQAQVESLQAFLSLHQSRGFADHVESVADRSADIAAIAKMTSRLFNLPVDVQQSDDVEGTSIFTVTAGLDADVAPLVELQSDWYKEIRASFRDMEDFAILTVDYR